MKQFQSSYRRIGEQLLLYGLIALIAFGVGGARAEVIGDIEMTEYNGKPIYGYTLSSLLVDQDTIHIRGSLSTDGKSAQEVCFELAENNKILPCTNHCIKNEGYFMTQFIVAPSNITYGIDYKGNIYRWTPHEEKCWQYLSTNSRIVEIPIEYINTSRPFYAASDTKIFEVFQDSKDGYVWKISSYDVFTGERNELYKIAANEMPILFTMPDGSLMAGYSARLPFLRIHEDGKVEELFTSDLEWQELTQKECQSILYLEDKGYLMLVDGTLYQMDDEGKTTLLNYTPPYQHSSSGDNCLIKLPGRDAVGFLSFNKGKGRNVLNMIPLAPQNITLLRLGGIPLTRFDTNNNYSPAFESANPSVKLVSPAEYATDKFADVAQWLTGKDSQCDLFLLHTADDGVQNVIRKGYYAPLQDDPDLTAYVEELYPGWRELVTAEDGALAALPVAVGGNTSLGYHRALWEQEELGELPTTYAELLDCIERWDEEGKLELLCLFGYRRNTVACLTDMLLAANAAHYASQGLTPVYSNDTLLSLLGRLEEMRAQLRAYDDKRVKGQPLIERSFTAGPEVSYENRIYTTLYLGFERPEDVTIPRTLYAYVINPYSQHQAEAKAFLNTLVHQMNEVARFGLVDGDIQGLEMERYAERVQYATESIKAAKAQLEEARAGGNSEETLRVLESSVTALQDSLAYLQENRYDITPEAAAGYRSTMERAAVTRADGFTLVKGNAQSTITAFNDGKISAKDLCRKLDEVVRMWVMENQ